MFKPNEIAYVRATGTFVTVKNVLRDSDKVETDAGFFAENDLHPAHPSVLRTQSTKLEDASQVSTLLSKYDFELLADLSGLLRCLKTEVDVRGHFKCGTLLQQPPEYGNLLLTTASNEKLKALHDALTNGTKLDTYVNIGRDFKIRFCAHCGADSFDIETDGVSVRLSGAPCPFPDGVPANEWELNVPSGRIVVANDLRNQFPLTISTDDMPSVNTLAGCRTTSQAYAAVGLAHGFVGNTCPGVYCLGEGKYEISSFYEKDEDEEDAVPTKPKPRAAPKKKVASICTDLWWYSICDADEWKRRARKFGGTLKDVGAKTVKVKPGVYRFKHNDSVGDDDVLYATFEWIRDPDPVADLLAPWRDLAVNPHAYVRQKVQRWPTLYAACTKDGERLEWEAMTEEQRTLSWARVADSAFCLLGGGTNWHEGGFPIADVDPQIPDIEPPSFRFQHSWYPFSEDYGGLFRVQLFSPSFVKLAFRVLESIISFGIYVSDSAHSRDVRGVRKRMEIAVNRYRDLAPLYPSEADPDYVWWLKQEGRAAAWVMDFNLGPEFTAKHKALADAQRWIPEGTYAVEFDASKLKSGGHFAAGGCWSRPQDATGYGIPVHSDNEQDEEEFNCCWLTTARNVVPLKTVARIVRLGQVSHMGETLVEVEFDYGNSFMLDKKVRKAFVEREHKPALRLLTRKEYEEALADERFCIQVHE